MSYGGPAQQPQLSQRPSRSDQRCLSVTQRRAVNQAALRGELGGGPLAGPKQRHTYISVPLLFSKNDRVALIRVMTKGEEWKGGGGGVRRVGGLDNIHTLTTSPICVEASGKSY